MILTGPRFLNQRMRLKPGDRFHVRIRRGKEFIEDEQEYKGYIHTIEDRQWEWWWMHMDAVELNTRKNVPIRTDKFMALPEVM